MAVKKTNKIKIQIPLLMTNFLRYKTLLLGPKRFDCSKAPKIALCLCWAWHIFLIIHWMCNVLPQKMINYQLLLLDTSIKPKKLTCSQFLFWNFWHFPPQWDLIPLSMYVKSSRGWQHFNVGFCSLKVTPFTWGLSSNQM